MYALVFNIELNDVFQYSIVKFLRVAQSAWYHASWSEGHYIKSLPPPFPSPCVDMLITTIKNENQHHEWKVCKINKKDWFKVKYLWHYNFYYDV